MQGYLKIAVLWQLSRKPLSGYALMRAIGQETGWKPSPGSIYPLLEEFLEKKLATMKTEGRLNIYSLTGQGMSCLKELTGQSVERVERLAAQMRACAPRRTIWQQYWPPKRARDGEAASNWLAEEIARISNLAHRVGKKEISAGKKNAVKKAASALAAELRRIAE